jgi:hypothetical protein
LERFNETLNDLDGELVKLKGTSKAYKKLEELSASYELIIDKFKQSSLSLDELSKKQIDKHEEIKKSLNIITNENKNNFQQFQNLNREIGKKLNVSLEELKKENRQFYLGFEKGIKIQLNESFKKQIAKHEEVKKSLNTITNENKNNFQQLQILNTQVGKKLNDSLEELRKENRQFYLDFEKVVRIKLDEHKSEIKQLIENERLQIKEIFENKLEKQTADIKLMNKKTNNVTLIFGIISSLLLIGVLVKLFM